ncbi:MULTISPECIES: hypothetical protein [Streptomyces]|uniref:hypothetical protein n=1 Tax=Streptomyces TaxID=1883 RepID=UPI001D0B614E|nr:hypothetical protein [Streptomyces longhuiensis]UDL96902.1 hypothetical protein LGI35_00580 [Streptomyces longhuiensis]
MNTPLAVPVSSAGGHVVQQQGGGRGHHQRTRHAHGIHSSALAQTGTEARD